MSGAFTAVTPPPARDIGDTQSFSRPVDLATTNGPVSAVNPAANTATAATAGAMSTGTITAAPATLVTSVPAAAPATGTVMAADLHQTDAKQIADLSRAVNLDRVQAAQQAATQAAEAVQSSLINKVTSLTGGVKPLFDATNQVSSKALTTAITKMGVPYVWGAVGPNAFDCSGLVQWSMRQAGLLMPRVAVDQARTGPRVPLSQLAPGDLLFYHTDATAPTYISHVAIYLGRNLMLQAPEPGKNVEIVQADFGSGFAGAVSVSPSLAAAVAGNPAG